MFELTFVALDALSCELIKMAKHVINGYFEVVEEFLKERIL